MPTNWHNGLYHDFFRIREGPETFFTSKAARAIRSVDKARKGRRECRPWLLSPRQIRPRAPRQLTSPTASAPGARSPCESGWSPADSSCITPAPPACFNIRPGEALNLPLPLTDPSYSASSPGGLTLAPEARASPRRASGYLPSADG